MRTEASKSQGPAIALVVMLALAQFLANVDRSMVTVFAPALRETYRLADGQIGVLQGVPFILGYVVASLWIGSRHSVPSTRRYVALCIVIWTIGAGALALSDHYSALFASRVVLGLGQAIFGPIALALLTGTSRRADVALNVSMFTASAATGRSGGLILGGVLIGVAGFYFGNMELASWRIAALMLVAPNIVLAILLLRAPPFPDRPMPKSSGIMRAAVSIVQNWATSGLYILAACALVMIVQSSGAWSSSILNRAFQMNVATANIAIGLITIVSAPIGHILAGYVFGRSKDVIRRPWMFVSISVLLCAAAAFGLAHTSDIRVALIMLVLLIGSSGFGAALLLITFQLHFTDTMRRSANSLFLATVAVMGTAAGPAITGYVSDHFGPATGSLPTALFIVVGAACAFVLLVGIVGACFSRNQPFDPRIETPA